jgi:outer membrane protein assembly factor BamA
VGETLPVLMEVEERHDHWGVVRAGAGASTDQRQGGGIFGVPVGFYGRLGYEHRNLFGQGWILNAGGEHGSVRSALDAQFTDPRLLGTAFRLNATGRFVGEVTPRLGSIREGGGTLGLARELYPALDASLTYGWGRITREEFLLRGAGPYADQNRLKVATTTGSLSFSLEWQRLDNPLVPTRGFKLQGVVELALPELSFGVGTDSFVKTSLRALAVLPLTRRMSLRHSVRHDQGFPFRGAALLPKVERFYAGGDTTLRGFDLDRARAESTGADLVTGIPFVQYRPIGGSLRLLQNIDLQFQINGPWFASVFADSGVVADSFDRLKPADFRHGAGVAPFLFRLPIGDLSVAWAWPLDPQPGDPARGRLHFNVGLMF